MIPPREYAERTGTNYQTVMLWLRQTLIPGAQKFELPTGGHYYLVPADAPKPQTRRGPKPKKGRPKKPLQTVTGITRLMKRSTKRRFSVEALPFEPQGTTAKPKARVKKTAKKKGGTAK